MPIIRYTNQQGGDTLRAWLVEARKKIGYSQKEVAKAIHIAQPTYSAYEKGDYTPKPEKAKAIGALLGVPWVKFYE